MYKELVTEVILTRKKRLEDLMANPDINQRMCMAIIKELELILEIIEKIDVK